jgi:hypothetical protein
MINLNKIDMLERMDLETGIFRILSANNGPSQKALCLELMKYADRMKKKDLELNVDKGDLSRKLKSLRNEKIIFYKMKKMDRRDQDVRSYFIANDLNAVRYIIKHFAKNIDKALDVSPFNVKDLRKFLEIEDENPRALTMGTKCALIDVFIKSLYVRQLIGTCGFKSIYQIYRSEVNGYCDIEEFIELAKSLIHDGSINNLEELGSEFKSDAEDRKKGIEAFNSSLTKTS